MPWAVYLGGSEAGQVKILMEAGARGRGMGGEGGWREEEKNMSVQVFSFLSNQIFGRPKK